MPKDQRNQFFTSSSKVSKNEEVREKEIVNAFDNHKEALRVVSSNSYTLTALRYLLAAAPVLSLVTSVAARPTN
jgi:hypothetical protein